MDYSQEQATHDQVNLLRLVRRLEKSIATESDWDDAAANQPERVWLQAVGALQVFIFVAHCCSYFHLLK
jgi:hypothetical protein